MSKDYKTLIIEGTSYKTNYTRKFESRRIWIEPDERKLLSYIPGTIVEILAKAGDTVKQGDVLLILEAMKMKNKITSPFDGKIKFINVKEGENIAKGRLILEFE